MGPRAARTEAPPQRRLEGLGYKAIDALLGLEELAGLTLSNRPPRAAPAAAHVVLVAEKFPVPGDPLVELARTVEGARVEAAGRPASIPEAEEHLRVDYREDDGLLERLAALLGLCARHPLRCLRDRRRRRSDEASLVSLAPVARRLERDQAARVQALGTGEAPAVARRLAALAGRRA